MHPPHDWTNYPTAYLEARQNFPRTTFFTDPLVRGTGVWSSDDWPSAHALSWLRRGHQRIDLIVESPLFQPGPPIFFPTFHLFFSSDLSSLSRSAQVKVEGAAPASADSATPDPSGSADPIPPSSQPSTHSSGGTADFPHPTSQPSPAAEPEVELPLNKWFHSDEWSDAPERFRYPFYSNGDFTAGLHSDGHSVGIGIELTGDKLPSLTDIPLSSFLPSSTHLPLPSFPSLPDVPRPSFPPITTRPDGSGLTCRLYSNGGTTVDLTAGASSDGRSVGIGIELLSDTFPALPAFLSPSNLWSKLCTLFRSEHVSFEASIRPPHPPAGMESADPIFSIGIRIGDREPPLPTFDWTGYPKMYLDARELDPYGAFFWDPIAQRTLVWSSDNWPSGNAAQTVSPQDLAEVAQFFFIWPPLDAPFPGEPGYAAWKVNHPEEAAQFTDSRPRPAPTDWERHLRRFAAEQRRARFPELAERGWLPRRRRRYAARPNVATEEEQRWRPYLRVESVIRRSRPPARRQTLYTTRELAIREGKRAKRTFPGEPGYQAWKAAHPKERAIVSTWRPPRPPRRRYSPFWGRSRIEIDWKNMKVRFVHEAFWNRRPIKYWSRLQRASRLCKAVLRRPTRPELGALDVAPAPSIEPFLPVIGSLLLAVPPTVLYFLNDYKTVLPFAAKYDADGFFRYTYADLMWRARLPKRLYFPFIIGSILNGMMEDAIARRAVLWDWYKRTYLPAFLPPNTTDRYVRENRAQEAAERARRLRKRIRRMRLPRWRPYLPPILYDFRYEGHTYFTDEMAILRLAEEVCPTNDWTDLPWYFPILQWWLPYWHWLNPPHADRVAARSQFPDYDYKYPAGPILPYLDEKGRKLVEVEITDEMIADAEDPKDTKKLEEVARRDAEAKERVLGKF